jgi:hypothetical protein
MVIGYNDLVHKGDGAAGFGVKGDPKKLKFGKDVVIKKEGTTELAEDPTKRNYLHLKPGTLCANLGTGSHTLTYIE